MDTRIFTCIECPVGCRLKADIENCKVVKVAGNKCPKGEKYAVAEVEDPTRVLTSAVLAEGLPVRMVPVRTDRPVPKEKMLEIMGEIKKMRIRKGVRSGEIIAADLMGTGANLIVTREVD